MQWDFSQKLEDLSLQIVEPGSAIPKQMNYWLRTPEKKWLMVPDKQQMHISLKPNSLLCQVAEYVVEIAAPKSEITSCMGPFKDQKEENRIYQQLIALGNCVKNFKRRQALEQQVSIATTGAPALNASSSGVVEFSPAYSPAFRGFCSASSSSSSFASLTSSSSSPSSGSSARLLT